MSNPEQPPVLEQNPPQEGSAPRVPSLARIGLLVLLLLFGISRCMQLVSSGVVSAGTLLGGFAGCLVLGAALGLQLRASRRRTEREQQCHGVAFPPYTLLSVQLA
jgi:hypothetical protein